MALKDLPFHSSVMVRLNHSEIPKEPVTLTYQVLKCRDRSQAGDFQFIPPKKGPVPPTLWERLCQEDSL